MITTVISSPIGPLELIATQASHEPARLRSISLRPNAEVSPGHAVPTALLESTRQLVGYFAGERQRFDLELEIRGSDFERRVWEALSAIPFGETRSYGDIARSLGQPGASRAVGLANGRNPWLIVVPCHRVIDGDGGLGGFGAGIEAKRRLLEHERVLQPRLF